MSVRTEINRILATALSTLLADAMEAKIRYTIGMAVVGQVLSTDAAPSGFDGTDSVRAKARRDEPLAGLREQLEKLGASVTEQAHARLSSELAAWAAAVGALATDATAPLPLPPA